MLHHGSGVGKDVASVGRKVTGYQKASTTVANTLLMMPMLPTGSSTSK
jgi:hypothetical protein